MNTNNPPISKEMDEALLEKGENLDTESNFGRVNAIAAKPLLMILEVPPSTQPQSPAIGMTINGSSIGDILIGTDGNDIIYGKEGRDEIYGGNGDDILVGGLDGDTLTGGQGNDKFVYYDISERTDVITDFTVMQDQVVLTDIFAKISYNGIDPIADGYLQFFQQSSYTRIQLDSDGPGGQNPFRTMAVLEGVTATDLVVGTNVII